jgi:hypothetical protein
MTEHAQRADRVTQLESQVSYHRERLALYIGRSHGTRPPNPQRVEELERAYRGARERLALLQTHGTDD